MNILPDISRSKRNQKMKFGQLMEYNMGNIFLEKSYTKCGGNHSQTLFKFKQIWAYLWMNRLTFDTVSFYWKLSWVLSKYIENKLHTTCFYLI